MRLVDNWKQGWKWFSVHGMVAAGSLPGIWCSLPGEWRAIVPIKYMAIATGVTTVAALVGRFTTTKPPESPNA